jgi:hypothetical protein
MALIESAYYIKLTKKYINCPLFVRRIPRLAQWLERSAVDIALTISMGLREKQSADTERFLVQIRGRGPFMENYI